MKKIFVTSILALSPFVAAAQTYNIPVTDANSLIQKAAGFIDVAAWILISVAVLFVIWNTVQFIRKADSPDDRKTYQHAILWGIVGLAVILSIWGLVAILTNTFGTTGYTAPSDQEIRSLIPRKTD